MYDAGQFHADRVFQKHGKVVGMQKITRRVRRAAQHVIPPIPGADAGDAEEAFLVSHIVNARGAHNERRQPLLITAGDAGLRRADHNTRGRIRDRRLIFTRTLAFAEHPLIGNQNELFRRGAGRAAKDFKQRIQLAALHRTILALIFALIRKEKKYAVKTRGANKTHGSLFRQVQLRMVNPGDALIWHSGLAKHGNFVPAASYTLGDGPDRPRQDAGKQYLHGTATFLFKRD